MLNCFVDTWLINCNELALVELLVVLDNVTINLFMSTIKGDFGVGNEDIYIENVLFDMIVIPAGI